VGSATAQELSRPRDLAPLLEEILLESEVPGIGAAIVTSERLVALGVAGVRERNSQTNIQTGDLFHIGSCTKAMTATLLGLAVEAEKLEWDIKLSTVLPELAENMDDAWLDVTLVQLLAHSAGMPPNLADYPELHDSYFSRTRPMREVRREVVKGVLRSPPLSIAGKQFAYSNIGYVTLGVILERLEQAPWEDLVREQLFEPLGMTSAGFGGPDAPFFEDAPSREATEELSQPRGHFESGKIAVGFDNTPVLGPAGTVHCTLSDWAKFARLHLRGARGENGLLLEPETLAALHAPGPGTAHFRNWRPTEYGGGWMITTRSWAKGQVLKHDGSNTAWFAQVWIAPEDDFAVIVCCNQGGAPGRKLTDAAVERLVADLAEQAPSPTEDDR
jgi:CubicO group peptidase (beta-lactamase class C family)